MAKTFNPKENLEYILNVGEMLSLGEESFFGGNYYLGYSGMPSKEVFSMTFEYSRDSKNLFYPISTKEIKTHKSNRFEVLEVNPEKIKLKYLGEK